MSEELINTILQYLPTILVVVEMVLLAFGQKTNLINGLKTIAEKADELKQAAEMQELQNDLQAVIEQNKALLNKINSLTNDIERLEGEVRYKED